MQKIKVEKVKKVALEEVGGSLKGFRDFALRGNTIELAVGVVIGAAFTALINALVDSVINPLIAALFGAPDLNGVFVINLNGSLIHFGVFLSAIINFLIIAASLYFFIIIPINKLVSFVHKNEVDAELEAKKQQELNNLTKEELLLTQIRDLLKKQQSGKLIK